MVFSNHPTWLSTRSAFAVWIIPTHVLFCCCILVYFLVVLCLDDYVNLTFMCQSFKWMSYCEVIYEMFHILNCGGTFASSRVRTLLKSWLFEASVRNCLNCVHNCDDHSLLDLNVLLLFTLTLLSPHVDCRFTKIYIKLPIKCT